MYPFKTPQSAHAMLPLEDDGVKPQKSIPLQTRSLPDVLAHVQLSFIALYNQCVTNEDMEPRTSLLELKRHVNDVVLAPFYEWWTATFQKLQQH